MHFEADGLNPIADAAVNSLHWFKWFKQNGGI